MKYTLPKEALRLIDNYMNLSIGSHKINCPYFQNSNIKSFWAVDIGKGLPGDIERKVNNLISNTKEPTKKEVLKTMVLNHIGIDCSGLSMRILDLLLKTQKGIDIRKATEPSKKGYVNLIRHNLRTYTNLSADTLTSTTNCLPIPLNDALPGDLIRAGCEHVGTIFEVNKTNGVVDEIKFVHSINGGNNIGVITGSIKITNSKLPIEKQVWEESDGKTHMLNEILDSNPQDSGIRRLKILSL